MSDEQTVVERLLASMEAWSASDIFVTEGRKPSARVNGTVVGIDMPVISTEEMDRCVATVMGPVARERFDRTGDADVGYSYRGTRFRFNFARTSGQRGFVARALASGQLDLDELGLPSAVARFADLPRGLVLVTGATGSGKSTTLAAMVNRINHTRPVHIVTLEDPIEFVHEDVLARLTQREVGTGTTDFTSRYVMSFVSLPT